MIKKAFEQVREALTQELDGAGRLPGFGYTETSSALQVLDKFGAKLHREEVIEKLGGLEVYDQAKRGWNALKGENARYDGFDSFDELPNGKLSEYLTFTQAVTAKPSVWEKFEDIPEGQTFGICVPATRKRSPDRGWWKKVNGEPLFWNDAMNNSAWTASSTNRYAPFLAVAADGSDL